MIFARHYQPETPAIAGDDAALRPWAERASGLLEFMHRYSGCTFAGGLYRVHPVSDVEKWTRLCEEGFRPFKNRFLTFATDWLGNQFALDRRRMEAGECLVLLLDPGTGEALEIPATFSAFHDRELVEDKEAALATSFFQRWLSSGGAVPRREQCVGHRIPLFLGGKDELENLEIVDMEVYWSIHAQLLSQTRDLKAGTPVGPFTLQDD